VLLYVLAADVVVCLALVLTWGPPFALIAVVPLVVLHRAVLIRHLERAARTDGKTGVLNAVSWSRRTRAELARSRRARRPVAVLMIDMDGFKRVNDEHGHLAGDLVLRRVAQALGAQTRRTDAVGRVGGDEFAVLLPATGVPEALAVAERIREEVRRLPGPGGRSLSTSIGVAVHPLVAAETADGLLAAADAAMYAAKDCGRDQVRLASRAGRRASSAMGIWRIANASTVPSAETGPRSPSR
jgi:diguanylate cyclase (GGDEF)-like protein